MPVHRTDAIASHIRVAIHAVVFVLLLAATGCINLDEEPRVPDLIPSADETLVWSSPQQCRQVVSRGGRLAGMSSESIRIATWNIRWFPWGCPNPSRCPDAATDIAWTACAIAWMDADVIALQEILADSAALVRADSLLDELAQLTSDEWQIDVHGCGTPGWQHVGFLWNSSRLDLSEFRDVALLNGASDGGDACEANLRPGRYARVDAGPGGADFHLFSVHFDSGREDRDYDHRRIAASRIPDLLVDGRPILESDGDVVVAGDFNTMGKDGPPAVTGEAEIALFEQELAPDFSRLPLDPPCTEYYRGQAGSLDHIVVSAGMREVAARARVTGPCAVRVCGDFDAEPDPAYRHLSDHCPVIVDIENRDVD